VTSGAPTGSSTPRPIDRSPATARRTDASPRTAHPDPPAARLRQGALSRTDCVASGARTRPRIRRPTARSITWARRTRGTLNGVDLRDCNGRSRAPSRTVVDGHTVKDGHTVDRTRYRRGSDRARSTPTAVPPSRATRHTKRSTTRSKQRSLADDDERRRQHSIPFGYQQSTGVPADRRRSTCRAGSRRTRRAGSSVLRCTATEGPGRASRCTCGDPVTGRPSP
jgi:hypothetical protein